MTWRLLSTKCSPVGTNPQRGNARSAAATLGAQLRFERLRRRVMPFAEARGYLVDEDLFKEN
jgi:hypothetical protein